MKILDADEVKSVIVETDDSEWPFYRRNSHDNWEVLMGESWETYYYCKEIEMAYQEFIKKYNLDA